MSSVYNYMFENLSRVGDDVTSLSERNHMNTNFGNYTTTNFFDKKDCLKSPIHMATTQPSVFVNGGKNTVGLNGCAVDSDNTVRIQTMQTNQRCRINLFTRPFVTVPYLGRGIQSVDEETILKQGDLSSSRKTATGHTEESHKNPEEYPLIDSIRHSVTNPNNLVEASADKDWVRGGVPSREFNRENANKSNL